MHFNSVEPIFCFSPSWTHSGCTMGVAAVADGLMASTSFVYLYGGWYSLCERLLFFFFFGCVACGILAPDQQWNPCPLLESSEFSKVFKIYWTFREVPAHTSRYPLLPRLIRNWSEVAQSCLTLCDPINCSLPGFSVHGIFQAGVRNHVSPNANTAEVRASCCRQSGWIFASQTLDITIFRVFFLSRWSVFSKKQLLVSFLEAVCFLARVSGV